MRSGRGPTVSGRVARQRATLERPATCTLEILAGHGYAVTEALPSSARDEKRAQVRGPDVRDVNWELVRVHEPVSYTHLDVYKRQS